MDECSNVGKIGVFRCNKRQKCSLFSFPDLTKREKGCIILVYLMKTLPPGTDARRGTDKSVRRYKMADNNNKKIVFSGVQPSGNLTIGNYLGAIKNFSRFSEEYKTFYCVVDLHAITVRQVPAELRKRTYETLALYMACGLDPKQNTLFVQSHVPQHAELGWILDCYTMFGELSRMTQFKDKSAKNAQNINAGLFTYPALMAADILLYQTDLVPVGVDQKQHLELARDIASRFNLLYSDTFKIPEGYISQDTMKIMSLQEPTAKMSKSDPNENAIVYILDSKDDIMRKFKRAVTDSDTCVRYAPEEKPGVSNLMTIYRAFTGKTFDDIEREFDGKGYGDFKLAVGEACADGLKDVREEFARLIADKAHLEAVMKAGAEEAYGYARRTMSKVRRKIGFVN